MEEVFERQAGSGDMCLSCHDGSVTDSRFKIWSTRHHTTDSVPSPAVKIPTETFPLDSQGQMTCATCHTAHAVPDSSDLKTVIFLRKPNVDSTLCLACHPEHAQKNDFQHPLGEVDYPIPTEILDAGGKTSTEGHTIICQTCHEPHSPRSEETGIEAVESTITPNDLQDRHHPRIAISSDRIDTVVQAPRSFLRYEGSQLCILCYDKLTDLPVNCTIRKQSNGHKNSVFIPRVPVPIAIQSTIRTRKVAFGPSFEARVTHHSPVKHATKPEHQARRCK